MSVEPGRHISHYRLVEKIGEGGMGVVWKAEDTVLNRTVAIKVLPADLAVDEGRRRLFLEEARLAASVSHGNIVQVYELGHEGDFDFIVMEYLEGQALNRLLKGRPLPAEKVAGYGLQIAQGLARAHHKGLIHRDIKPANILVTPEGEAKIVDFGLARLFARREATGSLAKTLTANVNETHPEIAGTLPYMSPEQVGGEKLDARSDIFSLGSVLYEMTTGQRPFQGARPADVAAEILRSQPKPVHLFVPKVPLELRRIVEKSLARSPGDRYQTTDDLVVDLRRLSRELDSGSSPSYDSLTSLANHGRGRRRVAVLVSVGVLAATGGAVFGWLQLQKTRPQHRVEERLLTTNPFDRPVFNAQISPDGKYLAYEQGGMTGVGTASLRVLSTGEVKELSTRASVDGWFPDGTRILLSREAETPDASIWVFSVLTGESQKLKDKATGYAVSPDGEHIAFEPMDSDAGQIWLMNADGGEARRVIAPDNKNETVTWWVEWSPDSRRIAYRRQLRVPGGVGNAIETCDLQGGQRTTVLEPQIHLYPGIHAIWLADGRILFSMTDSEARDRDSNLWEIDVNERSGTPRGRPRRILSWSGFYAFHFSATQDGRRVAFVKWRTQAEIYTVRLAPRAERLDAPIRLTMDSADDIPLAWMPDGNRILFRSDRRGTEDVFVSRDDNGHAEPFLAGPAHEVSARISPDRNWVLYGVRKTGPEVASADSTTIMRRRIAGGAPEFVAVIGPEAEVQCGCGAESRCVVIEYKADAITIMDFDPVRGRGAVLGRSAGNVRLCRLSPDGRRVLVDTVVEGGGGRLDILDLATGTSTPLVLDTPRPIQRPTWSASGDCVYAVVPDHDSSALVRVELNGRTRLIPAPSESINPGTLLWPSPDGERFAYYKSYRESTIWMLENP